MNPQIINTLQGFNEEEWIDYLQRLGYGLNPNPSLESIAPELIQQLFWIYNKLNKTNKESLLLFTKSLLHFLRSISPQPTNNKLIYDLIFVVHSIKPIEHRRLLELIIRDEKFVDLSFGSDNLHLLLMKSYVFVEDSEQLYLDEYLRNRLNVKLPYSLYVIIFYYSHWGYEKRALYTLSKCFADSNWTENVEACEEIYNTLVDCIPKYINLRTFLEYLHENPIKIDSSNVVLNKYIDKFIIHLKEISSYSGLSLLVKGYLIPEIETSYSHMFNLQFAPDIDSEDLKGKSSLEMVDAAIEQVNFASDLSS